MKAVVLEIKGRYAAVLSDNGSIKKVKNNNYEAGQEIEINNLWFIHKGEGIKMKRFYTKKLAVGMVCMMVLSLCSGMGVWAYKTPYTYVSLDVNPSIEYTLNRFDRVIGVNAVNDDGQSILDEIDAAELNNKSIEDAISTTVNQIANDDYFTESDSESMTATSSEAAIATPSQAEGSNPDTEIVLAGGIVVTVSSNNEELAEKFVSDIRDTIDEIVDENVEVEVTSVGLERVKEARALGVTPGKLNLVEKLKASTSDPDSIVTEEWLGKPVKEIMKEVKKNRKMADTDPEEGKEQLEAKREEKKEQLEAKKEEKKEQLEAKKEQLEVKKEDKKEQLEAKKEEKKEQLEAKKEEKKEQLEAKKEEKKEQLEAKKEEKKEQLEAKKEEKKEQLETKKEEKKEQLEAKKEEKKEQLEAKKEEKKKK